LEKSFKNIGLHSEELNDMEPPPLIAQGCGLLACMKRHFMGKSSDCVFDIRHVFQKEEGARRFLVEALPQLSEAWTGMKEIDAKDWMDIAPQIRVFENHTSIHKQMEQMGARQDWVELFKRSSCQVHHMIFMWTHRNISSKLYIHRTGVICPDLVRMWVRRCVEGVEALVVECPLRFSPAAMPMCLQQYYSHVVQARCECVGRPYPTGERPDTPIMWDVVRTVPVVVADGTRPATTPKNTLVLTPKSSAKAVVYAGDIAAAGHNTFRCRSCGTELRSGRYSKKVWKLCRADSTYEPVCLGCKEGALQAVVDTVLTMGFHRSLVENTAACMAKMPTTETLLALVSERQHLEMECAICFFPFSKNRMLCLRPCCRQAICSKCDQSCHSAGKGKPSYPCAFCRSLPALSLCHT